MSVAAMRWIAVVLVAVGAVATAAAPAAAQGFTPYDDYRTASGLPNYTGNLSPLADEYGRFGPSVDNADPWRERTRATRDFGEIADTTADYNAWRADRLTQMRSGLDAVEAMRREADRRWSGSGY
jgi:hypothetical protein